MAWIYIVIAALFETVWTFSVKFLKFADFKLLSFQNFYKPNGMFIIAPLVGYIVFGVCNVYFFSLAIKQLSAATAYAVWTGATLIFIKLTETFFFNQPISWLQVFFMLMIMTGALGLKFFSETA